MKFSIIENVINVSYSVSVETELVILAVNTRVTYLCLSASGFYLTPQRNSCLRIGVFTKPRFSCFLSREVSTENLLHASALFVYLLLFV